MEIIIVPKPLREKLGDDASEALVNFFNGVNGVNKKEIIEIVDNKFEKRLAVEIGKLRVEMHQEMEKLHTSIIRWMFVFWIGQIAVILGLLFTFFK